jgi:hypothetical protein
MVFTLRYDREEDYRKNYIKFINDDNSYYSRNYSKNRLVQSCGDLFKDQGTSVHWLLEELFDSDSRGISGELTRVKIRENKVILQRSRIIEDNPEDYAVEIDRDVLIKLATDWQNLVRKEAPEIFIFHKNDEYFVSDTLPADVE